MNGIIKRVLAGAGAVALIAGLGACSVAATGTEAQAIRYSGGALDVETFKQCHPVSVREYGDPGDHVYYYPNNLRTYAFTDDQSLKPDTGPIVVTTKDSQQVTVRGTITFRLTNDCVQLQKFHESIGKRMNAYFDDADKMDEDPGWSAFIAKYFTVNTNNIMDAAGLAAPWRTLYTDKATQDAFETTVVRTLATEINKQVGNGVITIESISIQRPEPDPALVDSLKQIEQSKAAGEAAKQKAKSEGEAEVEKVKQQRAVQAEKNTLAREAVQARKQCLQVYTQAQCANLELAATPGAKIYVLPDGTSFRLDERGTKTE